MLFRSKEGASSYNSAYVFNWAKNGRRGTSLDASTYGYGIIVNEAGYYDCEAWWRAGNGNHLGIAISGNRSTIEGNDSYGVWGHDHAASAANWSGGRYIGYLEAGWIITTGPPSSGYGNYGSEGYDAGLIVTRMI